MTKINQTLIDPEVPQEGTIRETVVWAPVVPAEAEHTFWLISMYGTGTDEIDFGEVVAFGSSQITTATLLPSRSDAVDTLIPGDAPLGTYACLTMIAEDFEVTDTGWNVYGIYDTEFDSDVLTVISGLSATIVGTDFARV